MLLDRLTQVIEYGCSAVEQGTPILRRLDATAASVEQGDTERVLKLGNGPRNSGLRGVEALRCLAHAARVRNRHEDPEVLQSQPLANTLQELHLLHPLQS